MPCDRKGVGCQGGLNLWVIEVDHCPLVCEHVHLKWDTQKEMKRRKKGQENSNFPKTFVSFFLLVTSQQLVDDTTPCLQMK